MTIDPKTFSPFAPEYVEPERPHGAVNAHGEWAWEFQATSKRFPLAVATLWRGPIHGLLRKQSGSYRCQYNPNNPMSVLSATP
jgi:hypothetical protein